MKLNVLKRNLSWLLLTCFSININDYSTASFYRIISHKQLQIFMSFYFSGAHIVSGNVFEPRALDELIPNWKQEEVCSVFRVLYIN